MQMSMTYGDISANILIDHQPWGADNVTVRLTDYSVFTQQRATTSAAVVL